jgi:hypothetical protein
MESLLDTGYQHCYMYRQLARDLKILSDNIVLFERPDAERMITFAKNLLQKALDDDTLNCLDFEECKQAFFALDNFSSLFSRFDPHL